jgi:hypothetical protein
MTFTKDDFKCRCCGSNGIRDELVAKINKVAEKLKAEHNLELRLNSGFRCNFHNREVGGTDTSRVSCRPLMR